MVFHLDLALLEQTCTSRTSTFWRSYLTCLSSGFRQLTHEGRSCRFLPACSHWFFSSSKIQIYKYPTVLYCVVFGTAFCILFEASSSLNASPNHFAIKHIDKWIKLWVDAHIYFHSYMYLTFSLGPIKVLKVLFPQLSKTLLRILVFPHRYSVFMILKITKTAKIR